MPLGLFLAPIVLSFLSDNFPSRLIYIFNKELSLYKGFFYNNHNLSIHLPVLDYKI